MLTHARLLELLAYDPKTGQFRWRKQNSNRVHVGAVAGCITSYGYLSIRIDGTLYLAHRLAWFYMTGEWPENQIDHKNRNRTSNNFDNLREADSGQNQANATRRRTNTSGYKGVYWYKPNQKWHAQIAKNKVRIHLGYFATPEAAHAAYCAASAELHGAFAHAG